MQAHETLKFAQYVDSAAEQMHYESKEGERERKNKTEANRNQVWQVQLSFFLGNTNSSRQRKN